MTRLAVALLALAVLVPVPAAVLAPVVLAAAGAVAWWAVDCARWPGLWAAPDGWSGRCR